MKKEEEKKKIIVNSEAEAIEIVRESWGKLSRLDDKWRNNKNIVLSAVKINGAALEFASNEMKKDKEIVVEAIKTTPRALTFADKAIRDMEEMRTYAYEKSGSNFIVDPKAFRIFERLDLRMMKDTGSDEEKVAKNCIYKQFKDFYNGNMTANEIMDLEKYLKKLDDICEGKLELMEDQIKLSQIVKTSSFDKK